MKLLRTSSFVVAVWLAALVAPWAPTQANAQEDAAESRATSFQAVEGAKAEQVPGGSLMVGAYAFVLVLLVGYVGRLGMMQKKTASEVERLTRAIEAKRQG